MDVPPPFKSVNVGIVEEGEVMDNKNNNNNEEEDEEYLYNDLMNLFQKPSVDDRVDTRSSSRMNINRLDSDGTVLAGNRVNNMASDRSWSIDESSFLIPIGEKGGGGGFLPSSHNVNEYDGDRHDKLGKGCRALCTFIQQTFEDSLGKVNWKITILGGTLAALYHTVFCLALASSISRPAIDGDRSSILLPMSKLSSMGAIISTICFVGSLSDSIDPLYPGIDLFLAPFLAHMARTVDKTLQESDISYTDEDFFLTFGTLVGFSMILTGALCLLSARWRLVNFGAFLPYATIAGFFAAVGVLLWTLAFSIDNGGIGINHVLKSRDMALILKAFLNHLPSFIIGIGMFIFDKKGPFIGPFFVAMTLICAYGIIFVLGISFDDAQSSHWFWSRAELEYNGDIGGVYHPFQPFGCARALGSGFVHWNAIIAGIPVAFAMVFIYTLRNFLHSIALAKANCSMKNRNNMSTTSTSKSMQLLKPQISVKKIFDPVFLNKDAFCQTLITNDAQNARSGRERSTSTKLSESSDFDYGHFESNKAVNYNRKEVQPYKLVQPLDLLKWYGVVHAAIGIVGGFACLPSISVSISLSKLNATGKAPQLFCAMCLLFIYVTDFKLVNFIPKAAFSSLIVKSALDTLDAWFVRSFYRIKDKTEWSVVPFIIILSFSWGMLEAFAVGVGLSTFVFVGAFYQSGVVKYIANGLTIRSTVERDFYSNNWLDQHADYIQVLVLQNYLFFGNASSCVQYIQSMFEDTPEHLSVDDFPPKPLIVVIDVALVTGMDTSAIDVFVDISTLCKMQNCEVYISGTLRQSRLELLSRGVGNKKSYFNSLERALGAAEDFLLQEYCQIEKEEKMRGSMRTHSLTQIKSSTEDDDGFLYALEQIDDQHGLDASIELLGLKEYVSPLTIQPGQSLFETDENVGAVDEEERGIFFVEHGILKVEKDPSQSLTRNARSSGALHSIGSLKARSPSKADLNAKIKKRRRTVRSQHTFRLARIGPGWIIGSTEACTGMKNPGIHIAVTQCRLHHLTYTELQRIEKDSPELAYKLLKLIAHLLARRQDITIEQMSTHHSILSSKALTKPVKRSAMGAIRQF